MARKIELLQAGRGLAALAVVIHHANQYTKTAPIFAYGAHGVDFFFVLSGFIICHVNAGREFDFSRYIVARLRRIFIPYLPIGVAMAAAYLWAGYQGEWSLLASISLIPTAARPALSVAWTLQYELMFYGIAALMFLSGKPRLAAILWGAVVLIFPNGSMPTSTYCLEFIAGFLAAPYCADLLERIRVPAPLVRLGDASYSVYLAHLPVMGIIWRLGAGGPGTFTASVVIPTVGGLVYHRIYESPALKLRAVRSGGRQLAGTQVSVL